jgi:hypothetical protein
VDWLTFISNIAHALAWPLSVVAIALLFRRSLLKLLPGLRGLEYGSLKITFGEQLLKTVEQADRISLTTSQSRRGKLGHSLGSGGGDPLGGGDPGVSYRREDLDLAEMAVQSPRTAVLEAWIEVEDAIRQALESTGIRTPAGTVGQVKLLQDKGIITPDLVPIIDNLRGLRNEAAHYPDFVVEPTQALEYARLARRIANVLWDLVENNGSSSLPPHPSQHDLG